MADELVDMKLTPSEKKDNAPMTPVSPEEGPDYPYGLCLSLGSDELDKLGISELPEVGEEFHVLAMCCVRAVREDDKSRRNVELQLTHLLLVPEDESEEESAADVMYPEKT